jgi:hypothetical protein
VTELRGSGPEFEAECAQQSVEPEAIFHASVRHVHGLVSCPVDWVGDHPSEAVAIFAELTPSVRKQLIRVTNLSEGTAILGLLSLGDHFLTISDLAVPIMCLGE